jgi:hypothetical protein
MSFSTFSTISSNNLGLVSNKIKTSVPNNTRGGGLINNFSSAPYFGNVTYTNNISNIQGFFLNFVYDATTRSVTKSSYTSTTSGLSHTLGNGTYTIRSSGYKGNITETINNWTTTSCVFETNSTADTLYDSSMSHLTQNSYTNQRSTNPYSLNTSITTVTQYNAMTTTQPYDDSSGKCPPLYIFNYIDYSNNLKTAKGNWIIHTTPNRMYIKNMKIFGGYGNGMDIPGKVVLIGRNNDSDPWYLIKEVAWSGNAVSFIYADHIRQQKNILVNVDNTPDTSNKYGYKQTCAIFTDLIMGGMLSLIIFDYDARMFA